MKNRSRHQFPLLLFLAGLLAIPCAGGAESGIPDTKENSGRDAITGRWFAEGEACIVHIQRDKDSGEYNGTVVWVKEPRYPEGHPEAGKVKHDRLNPDPAKRHRPAMGLPLLTGLTYDKEEHRWIGGTVYNPESGNYFSCNATMKSNDTLHLRGYIGIPLIGQTKAWQRVPEARWKALPDDAKLAPEELEAARSRQDEAPSKDDEAPPEDSETTDREAS